MVLHFSTGQVELVAGNGTVSKSRDESSFKWQRFARSNGGGNAPNVSVTECPFHVDQLLVSKLYDLLKVSLTQVTRVESLRILTEGVRQASTSALLSLQHEDDNFQNTLTENQTAEALFSLYFKKVCLLSVANRSSI